MTSIDSPEESTRHLLDKAYYVEFIHQYLAALSSGPLPATNTNDGSSQAESSTQSATEVPVRARPLAYFLHSEVQQIEYPNFLNPNGGESDYTRILSRADLARDIIKDSKFEVQGEILVSDITGDLQSVEAAAAVEALWTGTLAKDLTPALRGGMQLRARTAIFIQFRGGKVYRQRNYDCFDKF